MVGHGVGGSVDVVGGGGAVICVCTSTVGHVGASTGGQVGVVLSGSSHTYGFASKQLALRHLLFVSSTARQSCRA